MKDKKQESKKKVNTKFELSEEARITPEQKRHIKRLDDNRIVVSPEPKFESAAGSGKEVDFSGEEEKKAGTSENEESKVPDSENKTPESEVKRSPSISLESLDLSTSKFISLLASYEVPLEGTIEDLINEIKERGEDHLKEEMKKFLSKKS